MSNWVRRTGGVYGRLKAQMKMRKKSVLLVSVGLALLVGLVATAVVWAQAGQQGGGPDGGAPFPFEGDAGDYVGWVFSTETRPAPTPVAGPALPLQEGGPDGGAPFPFEEDAGDYVGWVFSTVKGEQVPGGILSQGFEAWGGLSWAPARMDAIAEALCVTEKTVEYHVTNILSKLGAASRLEAAAWVHEHIPDDLWDDHSQAT